MDLDTGGVKLTIIDKQGRIFNKWNLIDFFVVVVIIFAIVMFTLGYHRFTTWKPKIIPLSQEEIIKQKEIKYFEDLRQQTDKMRIEMEYEKTKRQYKGWIKGQIEAVR